MLNLKMLGAPDASGRGAELAAGLLAKPKALALLAYLAVALPRGLHRRDALLALLWPDSDTGRGRNSLRQTLHMLRSCLPENSLVTRGADEVGISPECIAVDVCAFESHLDAGREGDALQLYDGALLNGFRLASSDEFDAWLTLERERLHRRAVRGALVLATLSSLDGDNAASAGWARFALDRAPYDEDILREVIAVMMSIGDNAGAAAIYDSAVRRFTTDLGITVSEETAIVGLSARNGASGPPVLQARSPATRIAPARTPTPLTPSAFVRPRIVSSEARQICLEARQVAGQRSPVTIARAIELYEQAIRLAPDYAEAHSGLASALCQATVYVSYPGIDAWPRVRAHASRAIRLDPKLGEAHATLAHVTLCHDYDWPLAEHRYRQALELDPVSLVSRHLYPLYLLTSLGRADEALEMFDRARDEFPDLHPGLSVFYGMSCVFGRQFERGLREANFVLEGTPHFVQAYWVRGMAQEGMGDIAAAISTYEQGAEMTKGSSLFLSQLGRAVAVSGDIERATQILWELDQRGETGGPAAYYAAEILAAMGKSELALDRLYAAYRQRNPFMVFTGVLWGLDSLRSTRRFRDLLMRIGLPSRGFADGNDKTYKVLKAV